MTPLPRSSYRESPIAWMGMLWEPGRLRKDLFNVLVARYLFQWMSACVGQGKEGARYGVTVEFLFEGLRFLGIYTGGCARGHNLPRQWRS